MPTLLSTSSQQREYLENFNNISHHNTHLLLVFLQCEMHSVIIHNNRHDRDGGGVCAHVSRLVVREYMNA